MLTPPGPLQYERHTLRYLLWSLMGPGKDFDTLLKYAPRLANASANLARIEAALKGSALPDQTDEIRKALQELIDERRNEQEDPTW